jgi:5-hydroxyisourate hydrolase-like protein (transthyretin family)
LLFFACVAHGQTTISGRVVNGVTGFGIIGIDLDVFDAQGHPVVASGEATGTEGRYTLTLPSSGSYFIRADPSLADFFVDQYYSNVFLRSEATLVAVEASQAVTNINFSLRSGYQIRGFIRSQGVGVADVDLDLYAGNGEFVSGVSARSGGDGSFTLGVLPPGTYYVQAEPDLALGQYLMSAFYGGAVRLADATPIVITNTDVSGVVLDLAPAGGISGQVIDRTTASPLINIDLDIYDTNHNRQPFGTLTDSSGNYVLGPLPPGRYELRVDPTIEQAYVRTYYSNSFFHSGAQIIDVQDGKMTPAINFALERAGAVAGQIVDASSGQPLPGVDVNVRDVATNRFDVFAKSDTNGNYVLGPLPAGSYWLRAEPDAALGHLSQYYELATSTATAKAVPVSAMLTTSNINFQLAPAGWIEGFVFNGGGVPVAGIDVDLYEATTGERLTLGDSTGSNGWYQVGPIPAGQYKLRCDPTVDQRYAVQYYSGRLTKALADLIVVTNSAGTSNVNFTLNAGAELSGTVVEAASGLPMSGIDIDVLEAGTLLRFDQGTRTGVDGQFTIGPLPSGTYLLRADPAPSSPYLRTYYENTADIASALPIVLSAPAGVAGLEVRLMARPISAPLLVSSLVTPSALRISIQGSPGPVYQLETRQDLVEGTWAAIGAATTNVTGTVYWDLPLDSPKAFYRVRTL